VDRCYLHGEDRFYINGYTGGVVRSGDVWKIIPPGVPAHRAKETGEFPSKEAAMFAYELIYG
jgi:hypothetical protein